jgi:hypothetical protein
MRLRAVFSVVIGAGIVLPLLAGGAIAQTMAPRSGAHLGKDLPPQRQAFSDEHIVMPQFPGGWIAQPAQEGSIEVVEYLPKGQTPANWREKITLEIHHDSNTLPLDAFQRRALGQVRENCDGVVEGRLQTGLNNGFPSAFWTLGCKRNKKGNYGETRYTKGVQGTSTLYLLSRAWRTPAFTDSPPVTPAQVEEAVAFLTSAVVCGNAVAHPCPVDKAPPK